MAILLCAAIAIGVFLGYAYLFSTTAAVRIYQSLRRPMDALLALLFGVAAVKLLTYRLT